MLKFAFFTIFNIFVESKWKISCLNFTTSVLEAGLYTKAIWGYTMRDIIIWTGVNIAQIA